MGSTHMEKIFVLIFILMAGFASSQTFSDSPNALINDYATTDYTLTVSGLNPQQIDTSTFGLETVCIDLTHTWDSDLDIFLIAPDGTSARLVSGVGGADDNFTNTCFNYNASTPIGAGTAPFTGTFKPMGQMGIINNGQNPNGLWTLRITDTYPADNGYLWSWSITFGNNPASYFSIKESNLPIFVINTNGQNVPDEPRIMADMGIIWNGDVNRNFLSDPFNHYNGKVGIETRGASSAGFPKKSFDIELWDINGNDIDSSLCGMPAENDWVLSAQYSDKTLLRGMLTFYLYRQMGWYAPRFKPVELILNGEYLGIYILFEKVKRDNDRVDISKLQVTDIYGDELTGGYILKLDKNSGSSDPGWNSPNLPWPGGDSIYINYYYPDGNLINPQQKNYIRSYVDSFETALIGNNFMDTTVGYTKFANLNSCVDAFLIQEFAKSIDAYRKSFYMYKDKNSKGGKLVMAPIWDYDLSYGNVDFCDGMSVSGWQYQFNYLCGGDYWLNPFWFERMTQDTFFIRKTRCRWEELRANLFTDVNVDQWIDSVANYLNESQQWNFTIWPILGSYVWPNYYIGQNYQEEVDTLKWWIHERMQWIDNNLPGNPGVCNLTGINSFTSEQYFLETYPNPFINEINVKLRGQQNATRFILRDNLGGLISSQTEKISSGEYRLKTPVDLAPGIYFLEVYSEAGLSRKKIIKSEAK